MQHSGYAALATQWCKVEQQWACGHARLLLRHGGVHAPEVPGGTSAGSLAGVPCWLPNLHGQALFTRMASYGASIVSSSLSVLQQWINRSLLPLAKLTSSEPMVAASVTQPQVVIALVDVEVAYDNLRCAVYTAAAAAEGLDQMGCAGVWCTHTATCEAADTAVLRGVC